MKEFMNPGKQIFQYFELIFFIIALFSPRFLVAQEEISYLPLGEWRLITSPFGSRIHPLSRSDDPEFHRGIDIAAQVGDPVYAWRTGIVLYTGSNRSSGKMINMLHAGGYMSKYHHLSQILVKEGDIIDAGQLIGKSGNTGQVSGPHLHFSVLKDNQHVNPYPFLKAARPISEKPDERPPVIAAVSSKVYQYKELLINSLPVNGRIYIDEEDYGTTPLNVKLSYGEHFVEIDAGENYRHFIGRLWIQEDSEPLYTAQLQRNDNQPAAVEDLANPAPLPGSEVEDNSGRQ